MNNYEDVESLTFSRRVQIVCNSRSDNFASSLREWNFELLHWGQSVNGGCCENTVLKGGFGPTTEEVIRQWREMRNEEFHEAYNVLYSRECIWPLYLWWSSLTLATAVGGKTYRSVKNTDLYRCMTVVISLITSLKSDICRALTMHNTTDNNYVPSHAQNTTAFQPNIFLKAIHWSWGASSPLCCRITITS